ncbi:hypothetical protein P7K49_025664, partial [Saguinus oedipus]
MAFSTPVLGGGCWSPELVLAGTSPAVASGTQPRGRNWEERVLGPPWNCQPQEMRFGAEKKKVGRREVGVANATDASTGLGWKHPGWGQPWPNGPIATLSRLRSARPPAR